MSIKLGQRMAWTAITLLAIVVVSLFVYAGSLPHVHEPKWTSVVAWAMGILTLGLDTIITYSDESTSDTDGGSNATKYAIIALACLAAFCASFAGFAMLGYHEFHAAAIMFLGFLSLVAFIYFFYESHNERLFSGALRLTTLFALVFDIPLL